MAALQFFGSLAVRGYAARGSWVAAVPLPLAERINARSPAWSLDGVLRLVLARAAFARGDVDATRILAGALPASRDKLALEAKIALAGGDAETAARDAVRADDPTTLVDVTNFYIHHGALAQALDVQRAAVARLAADPTQGDALAAAEFRLGGLEARLARRSAASSMMWLSGKRASLEAYAHASALNPFVEPYLLALGNAALDIRRYALAQQTFSRAAAVSPDSAEPLAALGDLALRRGNRTLAVRQLARARALDPNSAAVKRLALALGR